MARIFSACWPRFMSRFVTMVSTMADTDTVQRSASQQPESQPASAPNMSGSADHGLGGPAQDRLDAMIPD